MKLPFQNLLTAILVCLSEGECYFQSDARLAFVAPFLHGNILPAYLKGLVASEEAQERDRIKEPQHHPNVEPGPCRLAL